MAREKTSGAHKAGPIMDILSDSTRRVTGQLLHSLAEQARQQIDAIVRYAQQAIGDTISYVAKRLFSIFLVCTGICFLVVALILALIEYAQLSGGAAFGLVGAILIIGGIVYLLAIDSRKKPSQAD